MSEEPRRSGRATKGQHTKASSSPAPNPKPAKGASKAKSKKITKLEAAEDDSGEDDKIRCICGNDDANDKRAFIGCEACLVWQHNVCMGEPEDEEDVPDHYFCEECRPEEHAETLSALSKGEKIWETRNQQWKAWKKMSAQRRKSKGKGEDTAPPWLKKGGEEKADKETHLENQETNGKRKREFVVANVEPAERPPEVEEQAAASTRPDKRRKSSQPPGNEAPNDADTAIVDIDKLPADRKKIAEVLSKIITDDVQSRTKSGFRIPDGHTAKSLGERYGGLIEYACFMNYGDAKDEKYKQQFRTLNANLKRNRLLIERLLTGSLTADELSLMESKDMLSEEKQREQAKLKEELDRQAIAVEEDGPIYRQSHKGYEKIEDETHRASEFASNPAPVRDRPGVADEGSARSPTADETAKVSSPQTAKAPETKRPSLPAAGERRRSSQHNFDMNAIWNRTAHSPTSSTANPLRPMQVPPRRRSSVAHPLPSASMTDGEKHDPDVDRMLQDDDEEYSPSEVIGDDTIVWRGKLAHESIGDPLVNARFVAGRDLTSTANWRDILPSALNIDGRLQIAKAEEYLCGLQWSHNSDVAVLALTPYDDAATFNRVFDYFSSRQRYAVINKDKPPMVKDLYVIPVEVRSNLPEHIQMLEHCTIKTPVEERLLLATCVVSRAPLPPPPPTSTQQLQLQQNGHHINGTQQPANGTGGAQPAGLPQHMRPDGQGPSGSPLNSQAPTFSPGQAGGSQPQPATGYSAPPQQPPHAVPPVVFQPNPYGPQQSPFNSHTPAAYPPPQPHHAAPLHGPPLLTNPLIAEILGPFEYCPTAQQVIAAQPGIERAKLENLRKIFEEDVQARENINALAAKLQI
ncbi:hypothetical protein M433DRAFT_135373 [Acidomyces richmondensis BFW]|nr:MAG: hypothetical protein FE78DRAFT_445131 [Acidomyces sp. 'richmondensis']KYG44676.1 hypothetical protein M433DRAFT_135373 [Acidomyces richmondensis BFW]